MKIFLFLSFCSTLILTVACDDREDFVEGLNEAPLFLMGNDTISVLSDSLKLPSSAYLVPAMPIDPNNDLSRLSVDLILGSGSLFYGPTEVDGVISISAAEDITYQASTEGSHEFVIKITDSFEATAELEVSLLAFTNLKPIAVLEVSQPQASGPFERLLDASKETKLPE